MSEKATMVPEGMTLPQLRVRIACIPQSHPHASDALLSVLPRSENPLAWLGFHASTVGWGKAVELTFEGRHAIRDAARVWDFIRRDAHITVEDSAASSQASGTKMLRREDFPVAPPVAFASCGFAWKTPSILVVPEVAVLDVAGKRFVITCADDAEPADPVATFETACELASCSIPEKPRGLWTQPGRMSQTVWKESVRRLIGRLRSGGASKVVMARDMVVSSPADFDARFLLGRLHDLYPTTWAYAVDGLVGASPEMLASVHDGVMVSRVLAGTTTEGDGSDLMENMKERTEHLLAVESVARAISPLAEEIEVPEQPTLLKLPNVTHLATDVRATLNESNVLDAAAALHPTAAVCGTPTPLAFDLLLDFERTQRGRYSGPVGWIDGRGEGEIAIALRCAQIEKDRKTLRVFAGAGIMPDSVPEAELAETRAKMRPILQALDIDS